MSDLSKNLISRLLLSALRTSVIVLKYLWIWFIWHTWKTVNKILKSKSRNFCVTTQRYRHLKVQTLKGRPGGILMEGSQVHPLALGMPELRFPGPLWPPQAPQPIQSKPLCPLASSPALLPTNPGVGSLDTHTPPVGGEDSALESHRTDFKSLLLHKT